MLFNSLDFAIFLPVVFVLYWFITNKNLKLQNFLIVAASYFFYGWWDWRFLSLIIFSSLVDFTVGQRLEEYENQPTESYCSGQVYLLTLDFWVFSNTTTSSLIISFLRFHSLEWNTGEFLKYYITRWYKLLYFSNIKLYD